jgi:site-specific recombinase XerD
MQDKLINRSHLSTDLEDLIQKANDLIHAAKAPSTRKAYQSDFRIFESWCAAHGLASLPSAPQTIALYIASCVVARLAPATIARRLASISKAHTAASKTLPRRPSISLSAKFSKARVAPWASHRSAKTRFC